MSETMLTLIPFLAADDELINEGIRFNNLPPNYLAWFVIPLAIVVFASMLYKREKNAPRRLRPLLIGLRAAAIFFIILLLYEPYRQFRRVEEIRSTVTVLVDESASMERGDSYDQDPERGAMLREKTGFGADADLRDVPRAEIARRMLGPDGIALVDKIRAKHDVKIVGYSTGKLRPLDGLAEAGSDGPVTATGDALAQVLADPEIQARPNAAVVLIGDGRTNTGTNVADIARHAGENDRVPIHAIGIGDPNSERDIELRFIKADEVVLKGNTLKMELTVRNTGYDDEWVTITVADQNNRRWSAPTTRKLGDSGADQVLEVEVVVQVPKGTYTLDVTVGGPANEENKRNNTKQHTVTVKDDKLRVLYVDTLPRWEYRRIKNFLTRGDQSFRTHCLLLSAEPSFVQEFTPGVEGMKPIRSFPEEFAELDQYDVLIFGDVDPGLLVATPAKLNKVLGNIRRFVENGGGLAVICGEGWTPRAYVDSPLEETLPVDITTTGDEEVHVTRAFVDEWKPKLTAIGRTHPIMQIRAKSEDNREAWEERGAGLRELRWWYPARKPTPAAQVLAYHPDARNRFGNHPILVAGVYGDGPVLFCATDETWRWFHGIRGSARVNPGPADFNRFWGNVVRYLARAHLYRGSKRYKLVSSASEYRQGETVELTAFVKDKNFEDATAPTQRVMVVEPGSKGRVIEFEKRSDGEYGHSFKPSKNGRYEAWVVGDEGVAGTRYATISFDVRFVDPERQNPAMNEAGLREIAEASGGAYFRVEDAEGLFERLRSDTTRQSSVFPRPLKSRAWLPAIFLGLLTIEWLLRKRLNMA